MENTENTSEHKKYISVGLLAHVDAGKTTLSESLLHLGGKIREPGRVDNKDAFLDTHELERARGITIFSKQAVFPLGEREITLLDTPGHVDFSAEMERSLQVMDYAILLINGADGVQGHTETLWRLLARYQIPVFVFVNKMDQVGTDKEKLLAELSQRLSEHCVDFTEGQEEAQFFENVAVCDEAALESYLEEERLTERQIQDLIRQRKIFPCYFGSALKLTGMEEFFRGLERYMQDKVYGKEFAAKVFKIARDEQGNRLTYMKISGGSLKVKTLLQGPDWEEKVDQIRIYSGSKYETANEVFAGTICAVTGLTKTVPGEGLGAEEDSALPLLEPVLTYEIRLPEDCEPHSALRKLKQLEEEEPELHIVWQEEIGEIHAQVMGEVQIEILKAVILERFGMEVEFGSGSIVYKETIAAPVEGVGHFEPLRHYAEVHLLLEPAERGSGLQFHTKVSEDDLDGNWQRLILTHLEEREHRGVLTGSAITDLHITLVAGRAHLKHTEGGDFRQATYRAVRQGLKKAKSILLEPYYAFRLELPQEMLGRAMNDIQKMNGSFLPPQIEGELAVLNGNAPVSEMRDYQTEVNSYTKGRGRFSCRLKGYEPCHNAEKVIEAIGYDSESDLDNPTGSVFCAHGAGFVVPWNEVEQYMHLPAILKEEKPSEPEPEQMSSSAPASTFSEKRSSRSRDFYAGEKELEEIFLRTYGVSKREQSIPARTVPTRRMAESKGTWERPEPVDEYLLVDGYNIIFSWDELKELSEISMDAARMRLMDVLCNYQGFKKCKLILVFDAYKVKGHTQEVLPYHNIHVVYTKEAETADQYIEKTVHEIGRKYHVTVATSDGLEQLIIFGQGAKRLSARELKEEVALVEKQIREEHLDKQKKVHNYMAEYMKEEETSS
ncbi:MAG: TetM/TetW/TetO/TetS family tetracycline resistance ribosomal protection protein [bacterium]|nr:TetM/TetW/TetO/TetS family tetracycline resistance ribosomal protection protein [bacterium]